MTSKRFLFGIVLLFCVSYVMFMHLQSSYKYFNDTIGTNVADVDSKFDGKVKFSTNGIVYPKETPTNVKDNSYSNYPKPSKVAVILNCEGRSGSTWLSSFFWNNPNVFYVYEPLFPSSSNNRAMETANFPKREGQILQLADTHKCKIDYNKGETLFPMVLGRYPTYQPFLKHCKDSNNCPASLTSYCQSKTHVVQKVIRVNNISDYQMLQKELDMPVKVIHLIRDPRPHIISREKLFDYMYGEGEGGQKYSSLSAAVQSDQRRKFCLRELSNIKIGDSSEFNANNYIRLTHEEMSLDPIKWAKKLYEFAELEFTKETEQYIGEITHGKSLVHNGKDPDGRFAGFSVYRDTLTVLYKWMTAKPHHIHEIEKECSELLDYLGYVSIYDDDLKKIAENPWPKIVNS